MVGARSLAGRPPVAVAIRPQVLLEPALLEPALLEPALLEPALLEPMAQTARQIASPHRRWLSSHTRREGVMPRKGQIKSKTPIGDVHDPDSLWHHMQRFSQWQLEKNYSPKTAEHREVATLGVFRAHDQAVRPAQRRADFTPVRPAGGAMRVPRCRVKRAASPLAERDQQP
jgi:hypothetical protein